MNEKCFDVKHIFCQNLILTFHKNITLKFVTFLYKYELQKRMDGLFYSENQNNKLQLYTVSRKQFCKILFYTI